MTTLGAVFRDSFAGAALNDSKWTPTIGAGGAISVSAGTLTMGSGTTINSETSVLSDQMFQLPCKVAIGLSLSQRIANQQFFVGLISVDPATGIPDGQETARFVFDGTTATQAKHEVTTGALAPNTSALSTYPTTATASLFEIEATTDDVWFHGTASLDGSGSRSNSYRLQLKAPDPVRFYKLQLRWLNGGTAPASNTNALITFLNVMEYQEVSAELTGSRGTNASGSGISFAGAQSVITRAPNGNSPTGLAINSAATTNLTSTKTTSTDLYEISLTNQSAAPKFFKLYNKASAPVLASDVPVMIICLPANSDRAYEFGPFGKRFNLGLAWAITNLQPITDATAVAAGDVIGSMSYV